MPVWTKIVMPNLILALAYCATGLGSVLLGLPPGYAPVSSIFPPAGIALGAVLVFGPRMAPGVFLGSFLLNLTTLSGLNEDPKLWLIPFAIAIGGTIQALVGASLVRWSKAFPGKLDSFRDVSCLYCFGGVVCTLISSSIGVITLLSLGVIPQDEWMLSWTSWWAGDGIGVAFGTPLFLIFFAKPRSYWSRNIFPAAVPIAVGFTAAIVLFVAAIQQERSRLQNQLDHGARSIISMVQADIDAAIVMLQPAKILARTDSGKNRSDLEASFRKIIKSNPGLQGIAMVRRVSVNQLSQYESYMRSVIGDDSFNFFGATRDRFDEIVKVPLENKDFYYLVESMISAFTKENKYIGLDFSTESNRRKAMQKAGYTNSLSASGPVRIFDEADKGLVLFDPIGFEDTTDSHDPAKGFVVLLINIQAMVEAVSAKIQPGFFSNRIEDVSIDQFSGVIAEHALGEEVTWTHLFPKVSYSQTVNIADRSIQMQFEPTDFFLLTHLSPAPWYLLLATIIVATVLGSFLLILSGRTARIEELNAELATNASAIQETNTALSRAKNEAESASRAKTTFLANVSHEIRTPLSAIIGYADLLDQPKVPKTERVEFCRVIRQNSAFLNDLVDDILDLSKGRVWRNESQ